MVIIIKRNADQNYDRLFAKIEAATILGRAGSLTERQTERGYEVELPGLDANVLAWVESKPRDFEVVS